MKFFIKIIILFAIIIIFTCLFFYSSSILLAPSSKQGLESEVCYKEYCFSVELAQTLEERTNGLMFRKSLAENKGMLFIFGNEGNYPFWMENTLIPLDIIWINKDKKVVFISENNKPCNTKNCPLIIPGVKASYVLEINAGVSKKIGLKAGDRLEISYTH